MNACRPDRGTRRRQVLGQFAAWAAWPVARGSLAGTGIGTAWAGAPAASPSLPAEVNAAGGLRPLGGLRFRYWGFHVYDAQLYVGTAFDAARAPAQRLALSLTYARAFRALDIVDRSLQEIDRQAPPDAGQSPRWRALLSAVLVDVQAGDRLTGIHDPGRQVCARFFHNGRPTGELNDGVLAERFFGIWLSPLSSQPAMRRTLLGLDGHAGLAP
ncbi:MAG: hypothetical protein EOP40_06005 [Rubrivivax sp.]|nr:MAG: hypothetical protein EOP40_06005 [Rubrivivax sp.]